MSFLYHSNIFIKVNRIDDGLQAECTLLNNDTEAVAWVYTDINQLKIKRAGWALYRSSENKPGIYELPELIGVEAYITGGPALKKFLGAPAQELPRELIAECFRGILQAETFFFMERGYQSGREYDDFCEANSSGACRYYSHLDQTEKQWTEWVETTERSYNLFNRSKTVTVQQQQSDFILTASFIDSFHHLGISMKLNGKGIVQKASVDYISAPDKICYANTEHLPKFIGTKLAGMTKKEIAVLTGGAEGCTHLVDLIYEIKKALAVDGAQA